MKYDLKQVKGSFNAEADRVCLSLTYFVRPLSFYLTVPMLRINLRPNQASLIALLSGVASMIFFTLGSRHFFITGVLLYFLFMIFDCVDGNIARITDSTTYYGKYLDGIIDALVVGLLPFSIAIGFYFTSGNLIFLFAGAFTSMMLLFAFAVINRAAFTHRWIEVELDGKRRASSNPLHSKTFPVKKIGNAIIDIKIFSLIAIAIWGINAYLTALFLLSSAFWAVILTVVTTIDSAKNLNVHRRSKWDTRKA